MTSSHLRRKAPKPGHVESGNSRARFRSKVRSRLAQNPGNTSVYVALDLLAAMGVNRGVRFLDTFGKIIFGAPYSRQLQ
jgi:hypothetical protein